MEGTLSLDLNEEVLQIIVVLNGGKAKWNGMNFRPYREDSSERRLDHIAGTTVVESNIVSTISLLTAHKT